MANKLVFQDESFAFSNAKGVGFYSTAPVVQRAAGSGAAVGTSAVVSGGYGYSTTQATAILTLVNEIRATLVGLGFMIGS
jgi:hypothetical protein